MVTWMRMTIPVLALVMVSAAVAQDAAPAAAPEAPAVFSAESVLNALKAPVQETYTGNVVSVAAGDLVSVNHKGAPVQLRLYGIDCPEQGQKFAEESRAKVTESVLNTAVSVQVLTVDSQGVPVALIFDGAGSSLSHTLAVSGLAWWDERNAAKDTMLRKLSAQAVVAGAGIFADPAPLAPWDYRSSHEMPDFTYALEVQEPEKKAAPATTAAPEPKELSAKGTMTENRPHAAASAPATAAQKPAGGTPLSLPGIPNDLVKDVDIGGLMMKHQPRIATDASGRPLGLTANNVGSIPYASQYGFQEGDIVSKVNGIPIESEAQIFSLIPQFQNVRNFQVEVLRNGQTVNIPINVK